MSKAPPTPTTSRTSPTPVKPPAKTSPLRLGILLGLLLFALIALGHHYLMAAPATEKAYNSLEELFQKRNSQGVEAGEGGKIDPKLLTPADVQAHLGKKPWYTEVNPDYTVECYWWYGMPHRNYVTVLYYKIGDNLRFHTHYLNSKPVAEDLPNNEPAVPSKTEPGTGEKDGSKEAPPMPMDLKPATETPTNEKPAAETSPPADKPAEDKLSEDKAADK